MPQFPIRGSSRTVGVIGLSPDEEDTGRVKYHMPVLTASLHGKGEAEPAWVDWLRF